MEGQACEMEVGLEIMADQGTNKGVKAGPAKQAVGVELVQWETKVMSLEQG